MSAGADDGPSVVVRDEGWHVLVWNATVALIPPPDAGGVEGSEAYEKPDGPARRRPVGVRAPYRA